MLDRTLKSAVIKSAEENQQFSATTISVFLEIPAIETEEAAWLTAF